MASLDLNSIKESWKSRDSKFHYQMLNRLQTDCDYYLGCGNRYEKVLWACSAADQIELMEFLYNLVNPKPVWLTERMLSDYKAQMLSVN